jgi:hypothetical protein
MLSLLFFGGLLEDDFPEHLNVEFLGGIHKGAGNPRAACWALFRGLRSRSRLWSLAAGCDVGLWLRVV